MFVRFAIDVLLATQTVAGASSLLRTSWDETWYILEKAVERGKARKLNTPMARIGIDEIAFRKGHNYITLIYDLERRSAEAISDGNDIHDGNTPFSQLSEDQLASAHAIAMDMSAAYVKSAKENIPLAEEKIVHDRFNIMKMATEAVDKVRRGEHRRLVELGDHRLPGTKYLWLTGQENLSDSQRKRFDEAFTRQLETGKA
jgi:transposase